MKIKIKKKLENNNIMINDRHDFFIFLVLIFISIIIYFNLSNHTSIEKLYLLSLVWYISFNFIVLKVKWFSGLGLYLIYLLAYVQFAVLMGGYYSYYTELNSKTIYTIMIYNFISPLFLIPLKKICHFNKIDLKKLNVQESWLRVVFFIGIISMITFYAWNGYIPLLAQDAENARVTSVLGKGFLIIIANNCFLTSMSLSNNKKLIYSSLLIGGMLLVGTGYRSQLLVLIIVFFLVNIVGRGKKFIALGIITITLILTLYAVIGLYRSSTSFKLSTLYMPILWRFFVNLDNYNILINTYPLSLLQYGKTFLNDLLVVLPGHSQTFILELKNIINYNFPGGSMTPSVFGEGYYNWGILGTILWPIFNLYFVSIIDNFNKKHVPNGLYFVVSFSLTNLATSSFIPPLINNYLPSILLLYIVVALNKKYKLNLSGR